MFIGTLLRSSLPSLYGDNRHPTDRESGSILDALSIYIGEPYNDTKLYRRSAMKADSAIIMSFFKNEFPAGTRINLKWPDKHEVTDFKLGQLGELVSCETETDQTGWVIVKPRGKISIGDEIPLL